MEKILLAIDAGEINLNTVDFACYIAKLTRSKITAVFLEGVASETIPARTNLPAGPLVATSISSSLQPKHEKKIWDANVRLFEDVCKKSGVSFSIHCDQGVPLEEMITESRFADMLIIDPETSFEERIQNPPTGWVKDVLAKSECPVVVAPLNFNEVDEILFAYDGTPSSVYAIKQFSHLFPGLSDKKVSVVQVHEDEEIPLVEKVRISELLRTHYSRIGFEVLHGKVADKLFDYLADKKNVFVVMGAFGRQGMAALSRPSTAENVIKSINLPVFIAHR